MLINKFSFSLPSAEGKPKYFSMQILVIDFPRIKKEGGERLNEFIKKPTLIGLDFLEYNKLKLLIDLIDNVAYLEDL